jgi:hypothetical protein
VLDLVPASSYFSIDGGTTVINVYNGPGGGDLADWAGLTADSYNAFTSSGRESPVSPGDITQLDVIGYDLVVPEPTGLTLLGVGGLTAGLIARRRNKRRAVDAKTHGGSTSKR